jgi:hypothetical protein
MCKICAAIEGLGHHAERWFRCRLFPKLTFNLVSCCRMLQYPLRLASALLKVRPGYVWAVFLVTWRLGSLRTLQMNTTQLRLLEG